MKDLSTEELLALLDAFEDEQALWEERSYIAFRLAKVYETRASQVEHSKEEIQALLARFLEVYEVYGKRDQR